MPISEHQIQLLPGAKQVIDWYGHWPSFHDAEIIEVHLVRQGESWLKVHTWQMTDRVDAQGRYELDKHAIIIFKLGGICDLELHDFNHQNVIQALELERVSGGIKLTLVDSFGLAGNIVASEISVGMSPGKPINA